MIDKKQVNNKRDNRYNFKEPHRWQPGESGNPAGRPPKDLCITSIVKEMLEKQAPGTENNPQTYARLIAKAILQESAKGNIPALKELLDRIEGKVADKIDIKGEILITPGMRALAAKEMIEIREEEAELLVEGNNAIQE